LSSEPSAIMRPIAATVAVKVGKVRLIGMRPAISQAPKTSTKDSASHARRCAICA
jgi:hypothetical protein